MYIHDLDLAKAKREAPAYTSIVYFKTIHLEPLQKKNPQPYTLEGGAYDFRRSQ